MPVITAIDTETTGLYRGKSPYSSPLDTLPYIIQIGIVSYDTDTHKILRVYNKTVRLPDQVLLAPDKIASDIHGITADMSKSVGVPISEVIEDFMRIYDASDLIIAHNMEFDLNIIIIEMRRLGYAWDYFKTSNKLACTMQMCLVNPSDKFTALIGLHERLFGIRPVKLHNALNDAIICLRCYCKMSSNIDISDYCDEAKGLLSHLISRL